MFVARENVKIGLPIFCGVNEFDGKRITRGVVTDVCEGHYLYNDLDLNIKSVWGFYDTDLSVANFTEESEVKNWLRTGVI